STPAGPCGVLRSQPTLPGHGRLYNVRVRRENLRVLHGLCVGHTRGLPREHAPVLTDLRVDRQIPNGEPLLLAGVLDVHVRHTIDDADVAVNACVPVARRDAAIVWLAGAQ